MQEARIHSHVEEIEFLKEAARRETILLLDRVSVDEILEDPDGFVAALVAAMLVRIRGRADAAASEARHYAEALGLSSVAEAEIAAVISEGEDRFITTVSAATAAALIPVIRRLEDLRATGVSDEVVAAAIRTAATREAILAPLLAVAKSRAAVYIQEITRNVLELAAGLSAELDGEIAFSWIAVMDDATCDDTVENSCAPRHNMEMTFAEWGELGRPGAPQLICSIYARGGSFCRCALERVDDAPRLLTPINVHAAIRAGRERAAAVYR